MGQPPNIYTLEELLNNRGYEFDAHGALLILDNADMVMGMNLSEQESKTILWDTIKAARLHRKKA